MKQPRKQMILFYLLLVMPLGGGLRADVFQLPAYKEAALQVCDANMQSFGNQEIMLDMGYNCLRPDTTPIPASGPSLGLNNSWPTVTLNRLEYAQRLFIEVERKTTKLLYKSVSNFLIGISHCQMMQTACDQNNIKASCLQGARLVKKKFCVSRDRAKESFMAVNFGTLNFDTTSLPAANEVGELVAVYDRCLATSLNTEYDAYCFDEEVMSIDMLKEKAAMKVEQKIDDLFTSIESPYYAIMATKQKMVEKFEAKIRADYQKLVLKKDRVASDYQVYNGTYQSLKNVLNDIFRDYTGMLEEVAAIHSKVKDLADLLLDPELSVKLEEKQEDLQLLAQKVKREYDDLAQIGGLDSDPTEISLGYLKMAYRLCAVYHCELQKPIRPNQPGKTWMKQSCFIMGAKHGINNGLCRGEFQLENGQVLAVNQFCGEVKGKLSLLGIEQIDAAPACAAWRL